MKAALLLACQVSLLLGPALNCDTPRLPRLMRQDAGHGHLESPVTNETIRMEVLDESERPPTFVMRGTPKGPGKLVFLHGMCGHGLGYAQSFQFSAAKWGTLIAPQGDIPCGAGPWAQWSPDLTALDGRIERAFRAPGFAGELEEVTVLGYSQGATRAAGLVRKWPHKYTRIVLMGGPQVPSQQGLSLLRAAVTMAGQRDRQDLMKQAARSLAVIGVPSTYQMIPGATHGAMGPIPEKTMGEALTWLYTHSKETPESGKALP